MSTVANGDFYKTVSNVRGGVVATITVNCFGHGDFEGVIAFQLKRRQDIVIPETSFWKAKRRIQKKARMLFKGEIIE